MSLEYSWFLNNQKEISKYTGKHIAIVGNKLLHLENQQRLYMILQNANTLTKAL